MPQKKEIKEKLAQAQAEVRRYKADLALARSLNKVKLDWKSSEEYLTANDRQLIPAAVGKWLPKEYVQPVLSACASYRYCCEEIKKVVRLREENPNRLRDHQRSRGRPPGGDFCVKALINELALIWFVAFGKLPKKGDNSRLSTAIEN